MVANMPVPSGWEDPLTGLEGPDFWQRVLVAEAARAFRYRRSLTVVVIDILGLDILEETWGGEVARHALRAAAQVLKRSSRTSDYCARIDATRFGVVLTETDEIAAINYVERAREDGPRNMPRGGDLVRFSFGWASPKSNESADSIVRRATDRLMADVIA